MVIGNVTCRIQGWIMMHLKVCIKRSLPLGLAVLMFLAWIIYLRSPSDHTKPVLSLTPVDYLTHSLKSLQMGEQNNGSSLKYGENREDSVILEDSFKTYYPLKNGNETTKLVDGENREDSVILKNSFKIYYPLENGNETTKLLDEENRENSVILKDSFKTYNPLENGNETIKLVDGENREDSVILKNSFKIYYPLENGTETTKLLDGENKKDSVILKDSFKTYYPLENGTETTKLLDGENRENSVILEDGFKTYYPLENGTETTKLLDIPMENISSNVIPSITFKRAIMSNSLQDDNTSSFPKIHSANKHEFNKLNFLSTWMQVLEHRQQQVVEVCRQNKKQLMRVWGYGNLLYDTKHHLAYCRTAKAGTTWWLGSFLWWAGVSTVGLTPDAIHKVANRVFPPLTANDTKVQLDKNPFIFMAVRHPFTRLVSAYHNKISSGYRKDLHSQMINSYRTNNTKPKKQDSKSEGLESSNNKSDVPTFREFVLFAAQQVNHCALIPNSACMLQVDVHWRPAHDRCAPCDVHYDAIVKLETFDSDERYIKLVTGMPSNKNYGNGPVQNSQSVKTGLTTDELTTEYFRSLTIEELNTVIQAYYYDFLLFGYDPHQYS